MTIQDISRIVCEFYKVDEQGVINGNRSKQFVYYRQIVMYFAKKKTSFSLSEIGSFYGKDHSTVHAAAKKVENYIQTEKKYKEGILRINRKIDQFNELSDKTNNFDENQISKLFDLVEKLERRIEILENKK